MQEGQPLSIVAIFDRGPSLTQLPSPASSTWHNRLYLMTSMPPKLSVALCPDAAGERIDEVVGFLSGIEYVKDVRIGYPIWQEET